MRKLLLAIVVFLGLTSNLSFAAERVDFDLKKTQDLLELCFPQEGKPYEIEAAHYCIAYIEGVIDYHDALAADGEFSRIICYPKGVTRTEAAQVLVSWGNANRTNTKLMHEMPVFGVVRAFQEKWPCQ